MTNAPDRAPLRSPLSSDAADDAGGRVQSDQELHDAVLIAVREAVGADLADTLDISVTDRRVTLGGTVADTPTAQAVERAAALPPGLLGVHNQLEVEHPTPVDVNVPANVGLPDRDGVPLDPPAGQINHKV